MNAAVRWTAAGSRLDGNHTIIFFPKGKENANRVRLPAGSILRVCWQVQICRRGRRLHISQGERKSKSSPVAGREHPPGLLAGANLQERKAIAYFPAGKKMQIDSGHRHQRKSIPRALFCWEWRKAANPFNAAAHRRLHCEKTGAVFHESMKDSSCLFADIRSYRPGR